MPQDTSDPPPLYMYRANYALPSAPVPTLPNNAPYNPAPAPPPMPDNMLADVTPVTMPGPYQYSQPPGPHAPFQPPCVPMPTTTPYIPPVQVTQEPHPKKETECTIFFCFYYTSKLNIVVYMILLIVCASFTMLGIG